MKHKLIALILLAIVLVVACLFKCPVQPKEAIGQSTKYLDFYLELVGRSTLKLLKQYSAECYADSSCEGFPFLTTRVDSLGNHIIVKIESNWIHREPTFTGFMQFLEEKYK